jgi:FkbM family methyltransferase
MTPIIFDYLNQGQALIHIGAHFAEERQLYETKELKVMWIEACPVFSKELKRNLANYDNQDYRIAALSRTSSLKVPFHISNNTEGVSSSFYQFGEDAKYLWPQNDLKHIDSLTVLTKTFDQFVEEEQHWFSTFNPRALLIDVQGAEIDVLVGAQGSLWRFDIIQIEASSAIVYENGNTKDKVVRILKRNGFKLEKSDEMVEGHGDLLFKREKTLGNRNTYFGNKIYESIDKSRMKHLTSLGLEIENKTILEVGLNRGNITCFLIKQGAFVTSIDSRPEAVRKAQLMHQSSGQWNGFVYDLDKAIQPGSTTYDIVLACDQLYKLKKPTKFFERIARLGAALYII